MEEELEIKIFEEVRLRPTTTPLPHQPPVSLSHKNSRVMKKKLDTVWYYGDGRGGGVHAA